MTVLCPLSIWEAVMGNTECYKKALLVWNKNQFSHVQVEMNTLRNLVSQIHQPLNVHLMVNKESQSRVSTPTKIIRHN